MRIIIESTDAPRYDTVGDWFYDGNGDLHIVVTNFEIDSPDGFLIALHELVEVFLCRQRGVSQQAVDDFDFKFTGNGEPGDDPKCPYRREHRFAMIVEHMMANELGLTGYGEIR